MTVKKRTINSQMGNFGSDSGIGSENAGWVSAGLAVGAGMQAAPLAARFPQVGRAAGNLLSPNM